MQYKAAHRLRERGVALATALMLMVLLLTLGVSLLTSSQNDLNFQRRQMMADKAQALAHAGVEYYRQLQGDGEEPAVGATRVVDVTDTEKIVLTTHAAPAGTYTSTGRITRADGTPRFERTIVVPAGVWVNAYELEL